MNRRQAACVAGFALFSTFGATAGAQPRPISTVTAKAFTAVSLPTLDTPAAINVAKSVAKVIGDRNVAAVANTAALKVAASQDDFTKLESFIDTVLKLQGGRMDDPKSDVKTVLAKSTQEMNDLDAALAVLDSSFDQQTPSVRYLGAQLLLIRPLRSIVWKMTPLFPKSPQTHTAAMNLMHEIAARMEVFFPSGPSEPFFNYVTAPAPGEVQFKTVEDLQAFLLNGDAKHPGGMRKALGDAGTRLFALTRDPSLAVAGQKNPVFDRRILFGQSAFKFDVDRFRTIGPAEVWMTLAGVRMALHDIDIFCAYNQHELIGFVTDYQKLYGINGTIPGAEGVTAKSKTDLLRKPAYKNLFTLNTTAVAGAAGVTLGASLMKEAFSNLFESVKLHDIGVGIVANEKDDRFSLIRPAVFHTKEWGVTNSMDQWKALVGLPPSTAAGAAGAPGPNDKIVASASHPTMVHSVVTGETTTVDLVKFYNSPPADLKAFLPTSFDTRPAYFSGNGDAGFRNFYRGRALTWDTSKFAPYLPDVASYPDTVASAARIISQSWGGKRLAFPLHFVLQ